MRARWSWSVLSTVVVALALVLAFGSRSRAQESGGSFGGSAWDDEPSGSSDWGSSGGTDYDDHADEARRRAEDAQREAERRRAEEEARARAAEEARQRAEEEARRRAEEAARIARERARRLALPPAERVAELSWPATPGMPVLETPLEDASRAISAPMPPISAWAGHQEPREIVPTGSTDGPIRWSVAPCAGICSLLFFLPLALLLARLGRARPDLGPAPGVGFAPQAASPRVSALSNPALRNPTLSNPALRNLLPQRSLGLARRVSIAFDWTARPALQAALAALAQRSDVRSRDGLQVAAREIAALLTAHAGAARYATWEVSTGDDARTWFQRRVLELRARFQSELVRNTETHAASARVARADEGAGLVVVTVVVASKVPLAGPPAIVSPSALASVLAALVPPRASDMQALEVVWSPAAENDRMSSFELERFYPELQRMTDGVGGTQCAYCRAPFPAELGRCPACGAPI